MHLVRKIKYLLIATIILGAFWRFYRLNDFPVQLNHDEVTQLYDAISIAQTGRDIYGNFLPFIFQSIGDFKPPFYTYITSIFYMIFGSGELIIRLPAALFGLLMIPAVFLFTLKLFKNKVISLWAAFFTSIAPFEIFFSRKSFENGTGIFLMLLGFTSLFIYLEKKGMRYLYLASFFLGIAMYTYFSHAVIIPLLLISFIIIFRRNFRNKIKSLLPASVFLIFFLPLFFITLINADARNRSQAVFITQDFNLAKQIGLENKWKAIFDFSWNRYLDQFKPLYLVGNGLEFTNQGSLGMGPLLLVQFPFLILGIIYLIRQNNLSREKKFILSWVLIGMLPSGLTFEPHSPHRSVMVFTMLNIISAVGLSAFLTAINGIKAKFDVFKRGALFILVLIFISNFTYFIHMYFVNFPFEKSESIHYPFKQVSEFAWSQHSFFNQIIFDPLYGESAPVIGTAAHYYLAYYGGYSPAKFQKEYRLGKKDREVIFDKFSIRKVEWGEDKHLKDVLIIGSSWSLPIQDIDKDKIIKTFYFYDGKIAFYAVKL